MVFTKFAVRVGAGRLQQQFSPLPIREYSEISPFDLSARWALQQGSAVARVEPLTGMLIHHCDTAAHKYNGRDSREKAVTRVSLSLVTSVFTTSKLDGGNYWRLELVAADRSNSLSPNRDTAWNLSTGLLYFWFTLLYSCFTRLYNTEVGKWKNLTLVKM